MSNSVRVQTEDFDLNKEYNHLRAAHYPCGAVVLFSGLVRDFLPPQQLISLELEHYPGMTEAMLQQLSTAATARWKLLGTTIIHRTGKLLPGDQIVLVGVSSAHRTDAFEAAQFIMDTLKTSAPFWKKETLKQYPGSAPESYWVAAKDSDEQLAQRW
ncbi:molybdenum cofactor biosynthesis protein MoaE [Cellvibrio sp. OA-2007]|uniref:molybdenum cofactor biosynthesis protein MoaE n=1 Tax=Cellvibrio sp. OA-2007 TaxID=529823 RepID=UPI0007848B0B|nr:molybdenum cofactor biosynthesis protein MoaE [Cellvibrio sp. OA-2007]